MNDEHQEIAEAAKPNLAINPDIDIGFRRQKRLLRWLWAAAMILSHQCNADIAKRIRLRRPCPE